VIRNRKHSKSNVSEPKDIIEEMLSVRKSALKIPAAKVGNNDLANAFWKEDMVKELDGMQTRRIL